MVKEKSVSFEPRNAQELSLFFEVNREKYHEIWVVLAKKKFVNPQPVSFNDAVKEAVKQGLIDNLSRSLSEQKYAVRFTKRKAKKDVSGS